ncbi:hypothetical protein FOMPIDRAFT_123345 [Fomitopsis schrenkii]|uniref:Uncharacterized protein n=1 Tax=Fomitopsis schrenkii TaxID=2126942 RepID=S8DPY5_FOMSC|nr:hypothetical protein FOMPIDRAFT_123345 [Fomitopsis schrenkii]
MNGPGDLAVRPAEEPARWISGSTTFVVRRTAQSSDLPYRVYSSEVPGALIGLVWVGFGIMPSARWYRPSR